VDVGLFWKYIRLGNKLKLKKPAHCLQATGPLLAVQNVPFFIFVTLKIKTIQQKKPAHCLQAVLHWGQAREGESRAAVPSHSQQNSSWGFLHPLRSFPAVCGGCGRRGREGGERFRRERGGERRREGERGEREREERERERERERESESERRGRKKKEITIYTCIWHTHVPTCRQAHTSPRHRFPALLIKTSMTGNRCKRSAARARTALCLDMSASARCTLELLEEALSCSTAVVPVAELRPGRERMCARRREMASITSTHDHAYCTRVYATAEHTEAAHWGMVSARRQG